MVLVLPHCVAAEEEDPLEFLVVEEVVEGPEGAFLCIGVRLQIRVVAGGNRPCQN